MLYAMHPLLNSNIRFGSSHWALPLPTSWLFGLQGWHRRWNEPHEWAKGQCKAKTRVRDLEAPKGQNVIGADSRGRDSRGRARPYLGLLTLGLQLRKQACHLLHTGRDKETLQQQASPHSGKQLETAGGLRDPLEQRLQANTGLWSKIKES